MNEVILYAAAPPSSSFPLILIRKEKEEEFHFPSLALPLPPKVAVQTISNGEEGRKEGGSTQTWSVLKLLENNIESLNIVKPLSPRRRQI